LQSSTSYGRGLAGDAHAQKENTEPKEIPKKIGVGYLKKLAKQNMYVEYIAKKSEDHEAELADKPEKKKLHATSASFKPAF